MVSSIHSAGASPLGGAGLRRVEALQNTERKARIGHRQCRVQVLLLLLCFKCDIMFLLSPLNCTGVPDAALQ